MSLRERDARVTALIRVNQTNDACERWAHWGLSETGIIIHSVMFKFTYKPSCLLHWLQNVASRWLRMNGDSRQLWKSLGEFLSLNSNPEPAIKWESILDPVIWQLCHRFLYLKWDSFSLRIPSALNTYESAKATMLWLMELWTTFRWNDWLLTELCWVQCIMNTYQNVQWGCFSKYSLQFSSP